MEAFLSEMAAGLKIDAGRLAARLRRAELEGALLLTRPGDPAAAGNAALGRWLRGHAPPGTLGPALRAELRGIAGRLELRPPEEVAGAPRPPAEGLPEAMVRLAEVKAAARADPRLGASPAQPDRLRYVAAQIGQRREVLAILDEFRAWLHDDLAAHEAKGRSLLLAGYGPVRGIVAQDRALSAALGPVEAYLGDAAAQEPTPAPEPALVPPAPPPGALPPPEAAAG